MPNVPFDSDGDVILVIPSEARGRMARFQVNSHSLCLASSVFRAMLGANAHFKEGNALRDKGASSPPIEVTLGEDEPKALALLLRIVHLQYDRVPRTLNSDQLYQAAIVCDKYDMRQVLGLWSDRWIPAGTKAGGKIAGDKWLFIAYAFGIQALFTELSIDLILRSTVGSRGSLYAPHPMSNSAHAQSRFNDYIPSSILAEISIRRQQAIKDMLDYIYQQIEAYRAPEEPRCAHHTKTELCDSFFLGLLLKTSAKLKVKVSNNHQVSISIQELKSQVLRALKSPDIIILQTTNSPICRCISTSNTHHRHYNPNNCGSCGYPQANHATTCSPIPTLKRRVEAKFQKIQGLELGQFVRSAKTGRATTAKAVPRNKDLWDYLDL